MKRFVAGLVLAAAFLTPSASHATVRWIEESLPIRITNGSVYNGYADSTARSWAGTLKADTTKGLPLIDILPNPFTVTAAGIDSALAFILYVDDEAAVTSTADTLYVLPQVSMDGATWASVTSTGGNPETQGSGSGIGGSAVASQMVLEVGTSNNFALAFDHIVRSAATSTDLSANAMAATAPNDNQLFGWRYVRFILTAFNQTGLYTVRVGHWADVVKSP